jgi:hypothetical protein
MGIVRLNCSWRSPQLLRRRRSGRPVCRPKRRRAPILGGCVVPEAYAFKRANACEKIGLFGASFLVASQPYGRTRERALQVQYLVRKSIGKGACNAPHPPNRPRRNSPAFGFDGGVAAKEAN